MDHVFDILQFYEFGGGSVFEVAATANGVTYNPSTPIATPKTQNTGDSGTASSSAGTVSTTTKSLGGATDIRPGMAQMFVSLFAIVGGSAILGAFSVM